MKTIKKQIKSLTFIFSMLILFQSCTAYKAMPISLEKASNIESKVKVVTKTNQPLKFKRIAFENGNYFGLKKQKGVITKVPLNEKWIKEIKEKDKTKSAILTIVFPIVFIAAAAFIFRDAFTPMLGTGTLDLSF